MHAFYCRLLHLHHNPDHDRQERDHDGRSAGVDSAPEASAAPGARADGPRQRPSRPVTTAPRLWTRGAMDRDRRPSLHTLLVPRLIDSGYTREQISELTGMPQALVELIADEHGPADAVTMAAATAARELREALRKEAAQARRRRRRMLAFIVLLGVLNITSGVASLVWRIPALGAAATLSSILLLLSVSLLARRSLRDRRDRSDPPR